MFGLMRMRGCGLGRSARETRRLNYCGTCKAMGRQYGTASRLLLNHDTALLAEIITGLSQTSDWPAEIQSRNCLRLPDDPPLAARYAAAATVFLASAKARDHVLDSAGPWWSILAHWLNPKYRRAAAELQQWGVPVDAIELELRNQKRLESSPESLEQLAGPAAFATAEICGHAARAAGQPAAEASLRLFGQRFGYLVYLLDAWEDFKRDAATGQFNAFAALYGNRAPARADLAAAADNLEASLRQLPLASGFRETLVVRLRANLSARLADPLPIFSPARARFAFAGISLGATGVYFKPKPESAGSGTKVKDSLCSGSCGDCCCEGCTDACCEGICG
jgi:hypothetical protein